MLKSRIISKTIEYFLYDTIEDFDKYEDLLKELKSACEEDAIIINIASGGGRVDVGMLIVDAIKSCKAVVQCRVNHYACSMAALIALSGDELIMDKFSFLMFHNYSGLTFGKGNELTQKIAANNKMFDARLYDICLPFLSKKECNDILNGKDVYIHYDDKILDSRIKKHFK